jgi:hypothetical protein
MNPDGHPVALRRQQQQVDTFVSESSGFLAKSRARSRKCFLMFTNPCCAPCKACGLSNDASQYFVIMLMIFGYVGSVSTYNYYDSNNDEQRDIAIWLGLAVAATELLRYMWQVAWYESFVKAFGQTLASRIVRGIGIASSIVALAAHIVYFLPDNVTFPGISQDSTVIVGETTLGVATLCAVISWFLDLKEEREYRHMTLPN